MRSSDDRDVTVGLHGTEVDQRHRIGLLVDDHDGAGQRGTSRRRLCGKDANREGGARH